jgi:hypothetical protein
LQQKETVIVRRYSTVFLLPPQSFTHQGFIFRQIQELCKIIQKFFCFEEHRLLCQYKDFARLLIMSPASSDPSPY